MILHPIALLYNLYQGLKFDWTITIGNLVMAVIFLVSAAVAWVDMNWRVKNLETWRTEHMVDADSRDQIINRMDKILFHVTGGREGKRGQT